MKVTLVPEEYVRTEWPRIQGFMTEVSKYTHGQYEPGDILDLVLDYGCSLWIAYEGDTVKGAVVTQINDYPRKRVLCVIFLGGVDFPTWKDPMLATLRAWAIDNKCDALQADGRSGWERVFSADGVKTVWRTFEVPILELGA
ncbi:hypothetical protein UFOVP1288_37 [uncultured Caudovirales phage]|uniref:Uncharacterized protein n=1 Tax=uncultured Caudovirales phage TaxID=2100421 RepID=A0A6J5RES0_9CAUD|nr:hypothetical protein UFOVP1195_37 [uncultured Caudovirales phage]CAB4195757.1 hypothetical protein UFOVP1288_37 [uncultured Caudovirales phage]CAB4204993.1 hypothetical protein UFOVP1409_37 [uncultured Caudovirales phage]